MNGTQVLRLASAIRFAVGVGLPLRDIFEKEIDWSDHHFRTPALPELYPVRNQSLEELEAALIIAIANTTVVVPTLESISKEFDCDLNTMRKRFPKLVAIFAKKRKQYAKRINAENRNRAEKRLDTLIQDLERNGQGATQHHLKNLIKRRGEGGLRQMSGLLQKRFRAKQQVASVGTY